MDDHDLETPGNTPRNLAVASIVLIVITLLCALVVLYDVNTRKQGTAIPGHVMAAAGAALILAPVAYLLAILGRRRDKTGRYKNLTRSAGLISGILAAIAGVLALLLLLVVAFLLILSSGGGPT